MKVLHETVVDNKYHVILFQHDNLYAIAQFKKGTQRVNVSQWTENFEEAKNNYYQATGIQYQC